MILTKCISSLTENCIKIPVEGLSHDVTVRLISSLTLFSHNAELVFLFPQIQDFGCTGKCDILVLKYSGTSLRLWFKHSLNTVYL